LTFLLFFVNVVGMLKLTDPVYQPIDNPNFFERWALSLILDKRDLPFVKLTVLMLITVVPFACLLYSLKEFNWWLGLAYVCLTAGYFLGPYILMLHNTSHRALFRSQYGWMKHIIPWAVGPFFGETPETYFAHHIGMHHLEENLSDDLSSTLHYQRDSVMDFLHYFGSFFLFGFARLLIYMKKKRRNHLYQKALMGELSYYVLVTALALLNWRATVIVFIVPLIVARFGMMAGNWAQHAFIDREAPENPYKSSITCINATYNRRCFNDGYHIGHHIKSNRHWTEMPEDFLKNRDKYAENQAIVFEGLDYFVIWFFLMLKRYDWLAKRFVQLGKQHLSQKEIISLLRERTQRIPYLEAAEVRHA